LRPLVNALQTIAKLRLARLAFAALLALGLVSTQVSLLDVPGYELAETLTLFAGLLGGALGIAAARTAPGRQWPARTALAAGLWIALGIVGATVLVILGDVFGRRCSPWDGLPFVLLLPLPTAFLATALGCFCGRIFQRGWHAALAYLALLLGDLTISLWPLYFDPQAFTYDQLLGWFPGPLYDELLAPPTALWIFRGLTLLATLATLLGLSLLSSRRPARRLLMTTAAVLAFFTGVGLEHRFGAITSIEDIDRALGGRRLTPHFVLHYPRELAPPDVERLARTAEFDYEEDATTLGVSGGPPIDIFFYRNAKEKGRLTGASTTHFTKPWLHQIHTHADQDGRLVLRHELVHALAAPLGRPPFGACATFFGIDVQAGIVEGLAMAVDWPADELTLHQWSRAMREAKLAPDIRTIVGPAGFLSQSQSRAYTLAGSFLRYLLDHYGREQTARLYRDGDFQAAYGRSLDQLAGEWEAFVDAVPLDAEARGAAQNRFRKPSLFARPCAREMAELRAEITAAGTARNPALQAEILGRCSAIDPGDPSLLKERWDAERAASLPSATATLRELLAAPALDPVLRAQVALAQGDEAVKAGDAAKARDEYQSVLSAHVDRSTGRQVHIMLSALGHGDAARIVQSYLDPRGSNAAPLVALIDLWHRDPSFASAAYLVGLRTGDEGDRGLGLRYLDDALKGDISPDVRAETLRRGAVFEIDLGRYDAAAAHLASLAGMGRTPAEEVIRGDIERRLAFEKATYGQGIPGLH
jgi:hypothetical protein